MKTRPTKRRIALIQLERSLSVLEDGDPISALTLAGAAEEILGRFAHRRGFPRSLELTADGIGELFDRAGKPRRSRKFLMSFLNSPRNHAKHQDDGRNIRLDLDWKSEAENMIFRAMLNHYIAFERFPKSNALREWMAKIMPR